MTRLSPDELAALKEAHPIADAIGRRVALGRPNGKGICEGQCLCDPVRGKHPLWVNTARQTWGCLKGGCGGDLFAYLEQFEGLDFSAALAQLRGAEGAADPAVIERVRQERLERQAETQRRRAALEDAERKKAYDHWQRGVPARGTLVDAYFRHRGLAPLASPSLRFAASQTYWWVPDETDAVPVVVHRGPAMLAAITRADGTFGAVHITWLDPRLGTDAMDPAASGKAIILSPEGELLVSKKMRGVKQGGAIRLVDRPKTEPPIGTDVLLAGEGIETVASAYEALRRFPRPGINLYAWAAGDLGNLSGGGLGPSTPHPEKPHRMVPPADPDPDAPGMLPPEWARGVLILGDGDSDPFVTAARLSCAVKRFQACGASAGMLMAGAGRDFNDRVRPRPAQQITGAAVE